MNPEFISPFHIHRLLPQTLIEAARTLRNLWPRRRYELNDYPTND